MAPLKTSIREQLESLESVSRSLKRRYGSPEEPLQSNEPVLKKHRAAAPEEDDAKEEEEKELNRDSDAGLLIQSSDTSAYEPLILSSGEHDSERVQVPASINSRLLEHQREGVKFLYGLYREKRGGILGDDMGLGKTIQSIAFISAILDKDGETFHPFNWKRESNKVVLILCPTSVIDNWQREFESWGSFSVGVFHGAQREVIVNKTRNGQLDVVLTSHDTFRIHGGSLQEIEWECVIIDEAHRLKNDKSQLYKACCRLKTKARYGLTGTILQNKLLDLFNVFEWASPGCLGSKEHFRSFYDEPIKQGQRISAPRASLELAETRRQQLLGVLRKFSIRRTKDQTIGHMLRGKEDIVVFCAMSPVQKRVYSRVLESPDFQCLVRKDEECSCGSGEPSAKCCLRIAPEGVIWSFLHQDHPDGCDSCPYCLVLPCLTKLQQVSNHLELLKPNPSDDPEKRKRDKEFATLVFGDDAPALGGVLPDDSFVGLSDSQHCGKMVALRNLLSKWTSQGDKVLLFSCSVRMLGILEKFLIRRGYSFCRLDGSTPMSARQGIVDEFNNSPGKQVFLISTRAGGLGLNLVSANRVVIFDPNWNPAQDLQAQDRSFRFGQKRHVTVFRLLAAGTLEELVYNRQIYKQQLFNIAVTGSNEKRYFEGVQDSKGNQGELFGVTNLFRDLKDKVLTSNIIGQYEERLVELQADGEDDEPHHSRRGKARANEECSQDDGDEHGLSDLAQLLRENMLGSQPGDEEALTNAGVLYAHRNEEVVNTRRHLQAEDLPAEGEDEAKTTAVVRKTRREKLVKKSRTSKLAKVGVEKKIDSQPAGKSMSRVKEGKQVMKDSKAGKVESNKQELFWELAKLKGMELKEFSQWMVSASKIERDELLVKYREK